MNILYLGKSSDLNIGNGKTVSAVTDTIDDWLEDDKKTIFSNIKLKEVEYTQFFPDTISEVLETENALVILDELHAIIHVNHKINEGCAKHGDVKGLCYRISEMFRQVRKRNITTRSTCQTFADTQAQLRRMMNQQIVCEKFHIDRGLNKMVKCVEDKCKDEHEHIIKRQLFQNFMFQKDLPLLDPKPYYNYYDSNEIVEGWVSYD